MFKDVTLDFNFLQEIYEYTAESGQPSTMTLEVQLILLEMMAH